MVLSNAKTEIDLAFTRKDLKGLSYENASVVRLHFCVDAIRKN